MPFIIQFISIPEFIDRNESEMLIRFCFPLKMVFELELCCLTNATPDLVAMSRYFYTTQNYFIGCRYLRTIHQVVVQSVKLLQMS